MTVGQWLKAAEAELISAGIQSGRLDALLMAEATTGRDRGWVLAHPEAELAAKQQGEIDAWLKLRLDRQPIAQLLRRREFYGLELEVTPDVLTPRVETEKIAELAIKHASRDSNLLDMGTGSGALAIAIAQHRPDLRIVASDVSSAALAVARRNAKRYKLSIDFVQSDLWQAVSGRFSTIVTNLPYLSDEAMAQLMPDAKHEPRVALHGGRDGLDIYRRFLASLPDHLEPGGLLFTECDPWQQADLKAEALRAGLSPVAEDYFVLGFKTT